MNGKEEEENELYEKERIGKIDRGGVKLKGEFKKEQRKVRKNMSSIYFGFSVFIFSQDVFFADEI